MRRATTVNAPRPDLDIVGSGTPTLYRARGGRSTLAASVRRVRSALLLDDQPPRLVGFGVAFAAVGLCTAVIYPLKQIAPAVSLGVVYLLAVLLISANWGFALGLFTALVSATAFNFFHLPPAGHFTIRDPENWVALVAFLVAAGLASSVADLARARAREANERRREADLSAEMARVLLRGDRLDEALALAAQRLAQALGLPSAAIELEAIESDDRHLAFPLRDGSRRLGTLLVPRASSERVLRRLQVRVAPALEALLAAALERVRLASEVVETAALRRGDVVKTALLRTVSHDLRSPLTAIITASDSVASPRVDASEREEMASVIREEAGRLARLVDNLLDLSRLQAGAAEPRREWCAIDEVIESAAEELDASGGAVALSLGKELPLLRADAAQLERAVANVLENALRHSGGHPVSVRARGGANRILVRIVDRGPGVPSAQLERVFEPFYQAGSGGTEGRGSGLGLAIARGFVEANGGRLWLESLPAQGATFVFELPVPAAEATSRGPSQPTRAAR